jgi:hypothetical protein
MTRDSFSHLIQEELSSFSIEEGRPVILNVFQSLSPMFVDVFQSYIDKDDLTKKISLLLESYRRNLQTAHQHLVPIHLFSLIVFDRLEKEAVDCDDFQLQQIWSNVADKFIDISLEVNNA